MTEDQAQQRSDWGVASIRLSVFSAVGTLNAETIFKEFFGIEPDTATTQKSAFLTELAATHQGLVYQVSVAGPKIDVKVSAPLDTTSAKPLPILEQAETLRSLFERKSPDLLARVSNVQRFAVGEHFLIPTSSRVAAYKILGSCLPSVDVDAENSSDFLYRINRPREIELGGKKILVNRLSQWGCLVFNVIVTSAEVSKTANIGDTVSLLTDVNSAQGVDIGTILDTRQQSQLITILFALSREISEKGDLP
jgi:hypothetical protein